MKRFKNILNKIFKNINKKKENNKQIINTYDNQILYYYYIHFLHFLPTLKKIQKIYTYNP